MGSVIPPQLVSMEKEVRDIFKVLNTFFGRMDQTEDEDRKFKQLEGTSARMRDAKRLIKEFNNEINLEQGNMDPETFAMLHDRKQSLNKELHGFVLLRRNYACSLGSKSELPGFSSLGGKSEFPGSSSLSGKDSSNLELSPYKEPQLDEINEVQTSQGMPAKCGGSSTSVDVPPNQSDPPDQPPKQDNEVDPFRPTLRKEFLSRCLLLLMVVIFVGIFVLIVAMIASSGKKVPTAAGAPTGNRRLLMTNSPLLQL